MYILHMHIVFIAEYNSAIVIAKSLIIEYALIRVLLFVQRRRNRCWGLSKHLSNTLYTWNAVELY